MANNVNITIGADASNAESALKKFQGNVRKAGLALSAMGAGGALAIKGFTAAAIEQDKAMSLFLNSARNAGTEMVGLEAKIGGVTAALQNKTNFGDEEQLAVLAKMIPVLGSTEKAMAALPAIMDAAATTGRGLKEQSETLTKALAGTVHQAESLGIKFDQTATFEERLAIITKLTGGAAEVAADPFTQLSNATGDLSEKIGKALLPVVIPLIEKFTSFAVTLSTLNPAVLKTGAAVLALITAIGLIGGPLLLLVSVLPNVMAGFTLVKTAILGAKTAMLAFNATMLANPVVLIIAGIVGAVALLALAWSKNFGNIREVTRDVVTFIAEFYQGAINKIINGVQFLGEKLSFLLPEGVEDALAGIPEFDIAFGEKFDSAVDAVDDFAIGLKDKFDEFMFPTGEEAGEKLGAGLHSKTMSAVDKTVTEANEKLGHIARELFDADTPGRTLKENLALLGPDFTMETAGARVKALTDVGQNAIVAWNMVMEDMDSRVERLFSDTLSTFGDTAEGLAGETASTVDNIFNDVVETTMFTSRKVAAEMKQLMNIGAAGRLGGSSMPSLARIFEGEGLTSRGGTLSTALSGAGVDIGAVKGKIQQEAGQFYGGDVSKSASKLISALNINFNGVNSDNPEELAYMIAREIERVLGEEYLRNSAVRSY